MTGSHAGLTVAFFGGFDPDYPRTVVLREGLESRGAKILDIAVSPRAPSAARQAALLASLPRLTGARAILVPSFGHRDVPLASLAGHMLGIPVLFDPLVSRWDTQVGDLGRVSKGGFTARRLRWSDRLALHACDRVLCDTWEHGDFYASEFQVPMKKLFRIPVGADRRAFECGAARNGSERTGSGPLEVLYIGGFLPLHGLETILDAAELLEAAKGPRFAQFTLVGGGMRAPWADREIAARGLRSLRRVPRVRYAEALEWIAKSDVALGIFGSGPKARRVIPHKVYQALAVGVPVVTRRSRALAELFREGKDLLAIPAADPKALADALVSLAGDPERRAVLGSSGRNAVMEQASPARIGDLLLDAIDGVIQETRSGRRR